MSLATDRFPSFVADLPITRDALAFAAGQHAGQRRDADRAPFILHPLEVAHLLRACDYPDHVVAAGVLHDVIEDTDAGYDDLAGRFGPQVTALVRAVSEPPGGGDYVVRKARLRVAVTRANAEAAAIYAADKIAKARELRIELVRRDRPRELDPDKLDHYWASLELLEHRLGAHPLVRQLRFELEALQLLPPAE